MKQRKIEDQNATLKLFLLFIRIICYNGIQAIEKNLGDEMATFILTGALCKAWTKLDKQSGDLREEDPDIARDRAQFPHIRTI